LSFFVSIIGNPYKFSFSFKSHIYSISVSFVPWFFILHFFNSIDLFFDVISDSDLSDRKIFGDKVDKFFGINSNKNENKNNQNKINYGKNVIKGKTTKKRKRKRK